MSYARMRAFFDAQGLGDRLVEHDEVGDTVEHAAHVLGCKPEQIAKTMSFKLSTGPIVVAMAGDAKVNSSKFKATFHEKAVMVPWDQVEEIIGHEPGAVTPFALNDGVKVYLDISMKRFADMYAAGGSLNSTVHLTMPEIERLTGYTDWVDICKGWQIEV